MVQILLNRGRLPEAEAVIREAVNLAKADADRWILLVQYLVLTKQQAKAAQAVNDAEAALPRERRPLPWRNAASNSESRMKGPTKAK